MKASRFVTRAVIPAVGLALLLLLLPACAPKQPAVPATHRPGTQPAVAKPAIPYVTSDHRFTRMLTSNDGGTLDSPRYPPRSAGPRHTASDPQHYPPDCISVDGDSNPLLLALAPTPRYACTRRG